ncbi:MAG UNVERIFIED_CONTAM: hypothetical protein LVR18_03800 [Planctomycetaceae bacterium]|jgi:hypothetical protein
MLNEEVPAFDATQTGARSPANGAGTNVQKARSAAFAALLTETDKAALRAYARSGLAAAALGVSATAQEAMDIIRNISGFTRVEALNPNSFVAAHADSVFGTIAAGVATTAPQTWPAGAITAMHTALLTEATNYVAAVTPINAKVGPSTAEVISLSFPDLSTYNLNLDALNVTGATNTGAIGAQAAVAAAIGELTAAASAINIQIEAGEIKAQHLEELSADGMDRYEEIQTPNAAEISARISKAQSMVGLLMSYA